LKDAEDQGSEAAGLLLRDFLLAPEGEAESFMEDQEGKITTVKSEQLRGKRTSH